MGIKNSGKAKIKANAGKAPTKETVKTPFSQCTSKNPLECRFHGLQALGLKLQSILPSLGYNIPYSTEKLEDDNEYVIWLNGNFDVHDGNFLQEFSDAFEQQGWDLGFSGKIIGKGYKFHLKKGEGEAPKAPAQDNDLGDIAYSPDEPPKVKDNEEDDDFSDDFDALLNEPNKASAVSSKDIFNDLDDKLTDEEVASFLAKNGELGDLSDKSFAEKVADWKGLLEYGETTYGAKITELDKDALMSFYEAAGADDKCAKMLFAQMVQTGMVEPEEANTDQDFDLMEFIGNPDKLKEADMSDFDALLNKTAYVPSKEDLSALVDSVYVDSIDKYKKEELDDLIEIFTNGTLKSKPLTEKDIDAWLDTYKLFGMTPYKKTLNAVVDKLEELKAKAHKAESGASESDGQFLKDIDELLKGSEKEDTTETVSQQETVENIGDFEALLKEAEGDADDTPTWDEIKEFLVTSKIAFKPNQSSWEPVVLTGKFKNGNDIGTWKDVLKKAMADFPSDNKVVKAIKKWMDAAPDGTNPKDIPLQDFVDWAAKNFPYSEVSSEKFGKELKNFIDTGLWCGHAFDQSKIDDTIKMYTEKDPNSPVTKVLVAKLKEIKGDVPKTKQGEEISEIMGGLDKALMKPLIHNDEAFPSHLSQKKLEDAILNGESAGGHGGLQTTIIEIDGKKFVCKKGVGKKANVIKNGFNADMAYRAGGVYAPDAKLYEYGDGVTYKLSEYIEGKRLIEVWKKADEAKRDSIRKELLKGYPLDVLFSNYDVLGTSPEESQTVTITGADGQPLKTHVAFDNIIIGNDGHAYRIDNDGAFDMTGTGGHKSSSGGSYTVPVAAEHWNNWNERQWIDDFRTMRRNKKNLGIFDRYTTADIFLAAGNINLDNVVSSLPKTLQKALAKPLFEMKQMTYRAVNIALGGYKNNGFVSMALDASYDASKKNLRELCKKAVQWNDSGFGMYKEYWGNYQPKPFGEKAPEPPEDPTEVLNNKLKNEEYTGTKIWSIMLGAAKTINHHSGFVQKNAKGEVLGNGTAQKEPDYDPNAAKIADWEKIDREKLAELAKSDEAAKALLGLYDTIAYSKENGWKKPIGEVPTKLEIKAKFDSDFKSTTEKKILEDMAGAIAEFQENEKKYQKDLIEYEQRKSAHKKREAEKAAAAGGSAYHNFHHFAEDFMEEGLNTDGIPHKVQTNGIEPIESSMESQKGTSYGNDAVKWKVREMMALGYTPQQILKMAESNELYHSSYYTNCINNELLPNKESWDRDMNSQAMYLGLNMLKMENETNDQYDKESGVVFLNRNIGNTPKGLTEAETDIYNSSSKTGWVGPHVDSAADCMQFEKNNWPESKRQVYAVPLSRIVCCANNNKASGANYYYHEEQEYVGNLYKLPCWVYHEKNHLTWKNAIDKAKHNEGMIAWLKKFAKRLAPFNTLLK